MRSLKNTGSVKDLIKGFKSTAFSMKDAGIYWDKIIEGYWEYGEYKHSYLNISGTLAIYTTKN